MESIFDTLTRFAQAPEVQRALVLIGLKSALILALAAVVAWTLRDASAARRHLVWSMALGSVLLLPILELALPAWRVGLMQTADIPAFVPDGTEIHVWDEGAWHGPLTMSSDGEVFVVTPEASLAPVAPIAPAVPPLAWLGMLWIAGALATGLYYLIGLVRLNGWTGKADPVEDERVRGLARDVVWELDVTRPVALRWTDDAVTPLTFGILKPVVLLPRAAQAWDDERLRVVLLHEFAHIRRLDALTQIIAQVTCALFWFNPLVWWGAHQLRVERERACDDYVLARGTRASEYAAHLLEIARTLRARTPIGVVSMAHRGELEGRLLAILEPERRREILNRAVTVGAGVLFAAVLLPLAAFKPWELQAQSLTTIYEAPMPPMPPAEAAMPALAPAAPTAPVLAGVFQDDFVGDETIRRTFTVQPGGRLDVDTDIGSIVVESGSGNQVEVEVEHNVDDFEVTFDQSGNTVRVQGDRERDRNWGRNQQVQFRIRVPARFNVKLETAGGSISVGDLEGTVDVNTSGGSLTFGRIRGRVRGHTSGGSIQLDGTTGDVEVETSGGSIRLGNVGGTVHAETSGGSISIEEVGGDVVAETSGGSVTATITKQPRGQCKLETSGGSIRVNLASGLDLDLDAETSGGRVISDFHPEHNRDRNRGGSDELQAKIGDGGPTLHLRTSAGSIHINRMDGRSSHVRAPRAQRQSYAYAYSMQAQREAERAQHEVERAQREAERAMAQHSSELEHAADQMGEQLSAIVGMAMDQAFSALDGMDWRAEMDAAMSELSDEELQEMEEALEEARAELEEARHEMLNAHELKGEVRREVEQALRESEQAMRELQREREARWRGSKGPKGPK